MYNVTKTTLGPTATQNTDENTRIGFICKGQFAESTVFPESL